MPPEKVTEQNEKTATVHQVHQNHLEWTKSLRKAWTQADGIATTTPQLPVGIFTADCAPILLASIKNNAAIAVMAVHAGWRGTAMQIATNAIESLWAQAPGEQICVAIGPTISFASFEVGEDVIAAFPDCEKHGLARFFRVQDNQKKYHFDLPGENARQIQSAASRLNINLRLEVLKECTLLHPDRYTSYRRDREQAGRMLSFVELTN